MLLRRCPQHCLDTSAPNGIKRVDIRRYTAFVTQFPPSTSFTASSSCSSSLASSSSSFFSSSFSSFPSFSFFLPSTSPPPFSPCPSFSSSSTSFSSSSSFTKLSSMPVSRGLQPPICRRFSHLPRPFSPDMRGKRDDVRMIACVAPPHLTIGKGGQLPWDLPEDRRYFFHCTRGHVLVLGRRSYEETGRALPDRETIVVSRTLSSLPDAHVASSLAAALELAKNLKKEKERGRKERAAGGGGLGVPMVTWIGGGHDLYQEAMGQRLPSLLYLTRTHFTIEDGDAHFPVTWSQTFPERVWSHKSLVSPCTFCIYASN